MPIDRLPRFLSATDSLPPDSLQLPDGSIWSHAATLGTRVKGTEFSIDQATVQNFVRVFSSGYPQKVPVDYDHAATTDDPEVRRLRAMGKVPKAGDVLEMTGVFAPSDFTGDLKTAAEKLAQRANRPLDDPRNYGLWIRWQPTARALQMIKDREYTELSIAFDDDVPHNTTGEGQGPGILAVALTNMPFLDDMLPVAASRHGGSPAGSGTPTTSREGDMTAKLTMLSVVAAMLAKPVTTEEEAIQELTQLQPELSRLRDYSSVVGAELGEPDAAKAVAKIRQLKADSQRLATEVAEAKKKTVEAAVETTMKEYEARIANKPLRDMLARQLRGELEAGKELAATETLAVLKALPAAANLGRTASGDVGGDASEDVQLDAKARELMQSNPRLKALAARDEFRAYQEALVEAERLLFPPEKR